MVDRDVAGTGPDGRGHSRGAADRHAVRRRPRRAGGVLPGVTIESTGEGGGARATVSSESGAYSLTALPPGVYTATFELTGFTTLTREGVVVQVDRTTRLDMELGVGGLQETVTVSGETPVVDVSSTATQTNIDKDLFDAIPTGRNPWVMAGPRARRRHRPPRRRRHRGHAAVQPRSVRLGRQPEVVLDRRPQDQLARRQRRHRRCSTTASRCTRNTTCRRRRAPRRAMSQRRLHEHGHASRAATASPATTTSTS